MKAFFVLAGFVLLAAACSNECELTVVENNGEQALAPVTVRVNDFSVTQEEMASGKGTTRAVQDVVNYAGVKAITLAFYAGSTEVYKETQMRDDHSTYTTFGEFTCHLAMGSYTMVVVARDYYDGDAFVLTSPTVAGYTSERARETFCAMQALTVSDITPIDLNVTLSRIMAMMNIHSTDAVPDEVVKIRTTYAAGSKSFNPSTGLASDNAGFSLTNSIYVDNDSKLFVGSFVFLATDNQTMTVTIEALDNHNDVLFTKVVPGVPLQRNRVTTLSGALFTSRTSAAFQLETGWIDENLVTF